MKTRAKKVRMTTTEEKEMYIKYDGEDVKKF